MATNSVQPMLSEPWFSKASIMSAVLCVSIPKNLKSLSGGMQVDAIAAIANVRRKYMSSLPNLKGLGLEIYFGRSARKQEEPEK